MTRVLANIEGLQEKKKELQGKIELAESGLRERESRQRKLERDTLRLKELEAQHALEVRDLELTLEDRMRRATEDLDPPESSNEPEKFDKPLVEDEAHVERLEKLGRASARDKVGERFSFGQQAKRSCSSNQYTTQKSEGSSKEEAEELELKLRMKDSIITTWKNYAEKLHEQLKALESREEQPDLFFKRGGPVVPQEVAEPEQEGYAEAAETATQLVAKGRLSMLDIAVVREKASFVNNVTLL